MHHILSLLVADGKA